MFEPVLEDTCYEEVDVASKLRWWTSRVPQRRRYERHGPASTAGSSTAKRHLATLQFSINSPLLPSDIDILPGGVESMEDDDDLPPMLVAADGSNDAADETNLEELQAKRVPITIITGRTCPVLQFTCFSSDLRRPISFWEKGRHGIYNSLD